jgi:NAD-dependent DNA ligase
MGSGTFGALITHIMSDIKVVIGNIKKESVLIDPRITVKDPVFIDKEQFEAQQAELQETTNILAVGANRKDVLKQVYG